MILAGAWWGEIAGTVVLCVVYSVRMKKSSPNIINYLLLPKALKRADMKLETDLTGFLGRNMLFILLKH